MYPKATQARVEKEKQQRSKAPKPNPPAPPKASTESQSDISEREDATMAKDSKSAKSWYSIVQAIGAEAQSMRPSRETQWDPLEERTITKEFTEALEWWEKKTEWRETWFQHS